MKKNSWIHKIPILDESGLIWLAVLLCFPAFLFHLGTVAFIGDEAIRTLVALEMKLSGNYLVPSLNGEAYYNKPPLYNWFILLLSNLFGYFGEWPTRMTTILFLALFSWTIYYFQRKHFDRLTSATLALMFLTSGRILFWDSMLGLIDISFSLIIYLNFMLMYHYGSKHNWKLFYISSYLLCSIAFLLKGLPAIVFQLISIVSALYFFGQLKQRIFSINHFVGITIGSVPALMYYFLYATKVSLQTVFSVLLEQSMQRTATHHGLIKTILHLFSFPFEQIYHFLPWSLFIILVFHSKFMPWVNSHPFVKFNFWLMIANLPVYWTAVEVYPRYLLMFVPMFNSIGYYMMIQTKLISEIYWNRFRILFIGIMCFLGILFIVLPLDERATLLNGLYSILVISLISICLVILGLWRDHNRIFLWFAIGMLVVRITFNAAILPIRGQISRENTCRNSCQRAAEKYFDKTWYIYDSSQTHQVARFYISNFKNQIVRKTKNANDPSAIYLVDSKLYPDFSGTIMDSIKLENKQTLQLIKIK